MSEYDYRCSHCQGDNISFMGTFTEEEELSFLCNSCDEIFKTKDQERGYFPNKIAALKERYPLRKKVEAS